MRLFATASLTVALLPHAVAAEKKLSMENLPPAVQVAVKEHTRDAQLVGLSVEKEGGKTVYEVETKRPDGKTVDMLIGTSGVVLETEEQVELNSIPAAAKAAIERRATSGTIRKVEKVTKGSAVNYEAAIKTKNGKSAEVGVNPDGTPHKS